MMFSIIVPIYKVEKYLPACIESVLKQEFKDYELILVDDGSPDNCPMICDKYASCSQNIVVIHKKNEGLSAARNTGVNVAKGEYIIFLDGDDVLNDNTLENLYTELSKNVNADVLIGNVLHWFEGKEIVYFDNIKFIEYSKEHNIIDLCQKYVENGILIPWRAWQSVYKTNFYKKNNLMFDPAIIGAEDCDFFFKMLPYVTEYILSDIAIVKYRAFREESIVNKPSYKSIMGQLRVFKNLFDNNLDFSNKKLISNFFADKFTNIIILTNGLNNRKEKKECLDYIQKNRYIISHTSKKPKYLFARAIWRLFGFERGNKIIMLIHK